MEISDSHDTVLPFDHRIIYSERYSDDEYEYRHVILPKPLYRMLPKHYFNPDKSGTLRILEEHEWRGIGINQSMGWEHYEVHGTQKRHKFMGMTGLSDLHLF